MYGADVSGDGAPIGYSPCPKRKNNQHLLMADSTPAKPSGESGMTMLLPGYPQLVFQFQKVNKQLIINYPIDINI